VSVDRSPPRSSIGVIAGGKDVSSVAASAAISASVASTAAATSGFGVDFFAPNDFERVGGDVAGDFFERGGGDVAGDFVDDGGDVGRDLELFRRSEDPPPDAGSGSFDARVGVGAFAFGVDRDARRLDPPSSSSSSNRARM
jgi:hypothetical protein